jgi:periplasmic protein TonB
VLILRQNYVAMRFLFTACFTFFAFLSFGQKIKYLDAYFSQVDSRKQATYYTETIHNNNKALEGSIKTYLLDSTLYSEADYSSLFSKKREGLTKFYYKNGKVKTIMTFKDGIMHGPLKTYYPNQRLKRAELYENGKLTQGRCFSTLGYDTAYFSFQTNPQFPGGQPALEKHIRASLIKGYYSNKDQDPIVYAAFMVKSSGEISIPYIRGVNKNYTDAVLKMIKAMPAWEPGTDDGIKVDRPVYIPINFSK